jgi:hypothetical protein
MMDENETPDHGAGPSAAENPPPVGPIPDSPGLVLTFETLLKKPVMLVDTMLKGKGSTRIATNLVITAVACLLVFGVVIGSYSMGTQLWAAPLKITLGMLAAGLICLPSLYIFSCLNGLDLKFSAAAGVLFATICMTALLLLGFTPVIWIFSQSTDSIAFMGALAIGFWAVSIHFGLGVISKTADYFGMERRSHLAVWMTIFILVSLQMTTSLRPIVGKSDQFLTTEKKFFLNHWAEQVREEAKGRGIQRPEQADARPRD